MDNFESLSISTFLLPLACILVLAIVSWIISLILEDVSLVDSVWSIFFLIGTFVVFSIQASNTARAIIVLSLVSVWALRLCIHLTLRNWNQPEDHRYQTIRKNNQPHFSLKSLYLIFILQAVLAWIIATPLLVSIESTKAFSWIDYVGIAIVIFGIVFESIADWQLKQFQDQASTKNNGVLDSGLWRYSRHPNYFGECCVWWGFYLIALSAGYAWTIFSPILLTVLILKVSGIALTEQTITSRRPEYIEYMKRTSAFIPLPIIKNTKDS